MLNPLAPLDVYATNTVFCDPAIDTSDPDDADLPSAAQRMEAYRKTRDASGLVMRPDQRPTVFVCKPLSASLVAKVLDGRTLLAAHLAAFVYGCHEIRLPDGTPVKPAKLVTVSGGTSVPANEDAWIDTVARRFGLESIYEIGSVIYERARLPEGARGPFFYRAG